MQKKYYIEDIATGNVLLEDDNWGQLGAAGTPKTYASNSAAETKVSGLAAGSYRIFVKYIVT